MRIIVSENLLDGLDDEGVEEFMRVADRDGYEMQPRRPESWERGNAMHRTSQMLDIRGIYEAAPDWLVNAYRRVIGLPDEGGCE